ncbi:GtrA family protein [Thaumasiovibrio subtropicus]|uniref:GtrA family protein n=1 Tax=Thaumasiovibrio subtropicus TaxID=1891207 RepID=UPI001FE5C48C|nr:GtrA family protein [Thaumasiovibrio subtropicus]
MSLKQKIARFVVVGGVGFVVDSVVFALCFYLLSLAPLVARGVAFLLAASVTWYGNRRYTFRVYEAPLSQWRRFMFVAMVSLMPNFGLFYCWIRLFGESGWQPMAALCAGVAGGMVSNFLLSQYWVFADRSLESDTHR